MQSMDAKLHQEIISEFKLLNSKDMLPLFEINGLITNSKYDPVREAQRITETNFKKNYFHILIGIGGGYIAKELYLKLSENEGLLIIEPNEKMFEALSKINEMDYLWKDSRISIMTGINNDFLEGILGSVVGSFNNRIQVIVSPNYEKIYPLYSKEILLKIKECLLLQVVNKNTLKRFLGNWQENFIENLYYINKSTPLSRLKRSLDCPIVIASGGPSLTKQLPLIKEKRENFILICAGSSINTLLANDITPDIIVSIDGGYENFNHFEKIGHLDVPLIYSPKIHKNILKTYKGKKIVFNDKGDIQNNTLLDGMFNCDIGEVYGGPSVANFCLDISIQLTTGPICLVGQDLAYTNNATHAKGNKNYNIVDDYYIKDKKMFKVEGYNGGELLTDYPLYSMKKAFENYLEFINRSDNLRVYNCTEGGALIEKVQNLPFSVFLEEKCVLPISNKTQDKIKKLTECTLDIGWNNLFKLIRDEKRKSEQVKKICSDSLKIISESDAPSTKFSNDMLKKLKSKDRKLQVLLKNEFLFYLFNEVTFKINNYFLEEENESFDQFERRIYLKSLALYEGILYVSDNSIKWFDNLLNKIAEEIRGEISG